MYTISESASSTSINKDARSVDGAHKAERALGDRSSVWARGWLTLAEHCVGISGRPRFGHRKFTPFVRAHLLERGTTRTVTITHRNREARV